MEKPSNEKRRKATRRRAKYSGPSYSDLPRNVLESILLRLSVKMIFVCKCVCKTWRDVISDPEFANLHFDGAEVYPLIQTSGFSVLSRMLYLVQPEQEDFELKLGCNRYSPGHNVECACNVKVKLTTKFRLPLRNLQMIVDGKTDEVWKSNSLKLNMKDHKYTIVNSCNGLLCLSDPFYNEPMVVCNPITGEFITLPLERRATCSNQALLACGFGFSPTTNQYKVVRMFFGDYKRGVVAEIHVLGTKSWEFVKCPNSAYRLFFSIYLNGFVYWYCGAPSVMFFDCEKDHFGSFSPPLSNRRGRLSMGALGGELCISRYFDGDQIDFWVMKDCGGKRNWSKMLSVHMSANERWPRGSYQPIKYLNNGALLMYNLLKHAFLYYNPKEHGYRYLKIRGMQSRAQAISHTPSFISLKEAVSGLNTTVLNVSSRCGELKLHKECKGISVVEKSKDEINKDNWELNGDYKA